MRLYIGHPPCGQQSKEGMFVQVNDFGSKVDAICLHLDWHQLITALEHAQIPSASYRRVRIGRSTACAPVRQHLEAYTTASQTPKNHFRFSPQDPINLASCALPNALFGHANSSCFFLVFSGKGKTKTWNLHLSHSTCHVQPQSVCVESMKDLSNKEEHDCSSVIKMLETLPQLLELHVAIYRLPFRRVLVHSLGGAWFWGFFTTKYF